MPYSQHRARLLSTLVLFVVTLAGCGGGSGTTSGSSSGGGSNVPNTVAITVDSGVGGGGAPNTLYTTVQICAHGSTTNCQTIDHVQVDTASYGFRVLSSVLTLTGLATSTDASGNAIVECTQFADGYAWGPVTAVDLKVAGLTATSLPIQVIGDPAYAASVPASCSNGLTAENSVATFGANGILGIGFFPQDCGTLCSTGTSAPTGRYYSCTLGGGGTCTPTFVSLVAQVLNPVPLFSTNNNGVVIQLPAQSAPGAASTTGTLFFGIGTESNNTLTAHALYAVDSATGANPGTFATTFVGVSGLGFIDTGSNAYFFSDGAIPTCSATQLTGFYCPSGTDALSATIQGNGTNGNSVTVDFSIDNASTLSGYGYSVLPTLGGTTGTSLSGYFDWGLPFYYGRTVFLAYDGATVSGTNSAGPWIGF